MIASRWVAVLAMLWLGNGACSVSLAQDNQDACVQCVCEADNTCSPDIICNGQLDECENITFYPICGDGYYRMLVQLTCNGSGGCDDCMPCAMIYGNGQEMIRCHTPSQQGDWCKNECGAVWLDGDTQYTLYVCLRKRTSCNDCNQEGCTARAWVYRQWSVDCNPAPACTP